jgi:hypothetical protein
MNSKNTVTQNKRSIEPYKKIHNVIYSLPAEKTLKKTQAIKTTERNPFLDFFCI